MTVPILVQKYGGSSVADVERLGKVADKVVATKRAGNAVCVVVSAMGKTTDGLLDLARQVTTDPARRELDMLVSTGERVSMALLSMAIQARGEDAVSFTGSQCGIVTNDRHFDARILEVRPFRIEDELAKGKIVIVAGYQGVSYKKEITTLGRGGSDTTAVALAAALGAERCEIYSDVDGVYSADPRVVADARHLPALSWAEMQEMAEAGAKVLNAEAVEFAKKAGIRIYARQTSGSDRETIVGDVARSEGGVRAVVSEKAIARVRVRGNGKSLRAVLTAAREAQIPVKELSALSGPRGGDARASFVVGLQNVPDWSRGRAMLTAVSDVEIDEGLGTLSLVGEGLHRDPETLALAIETCDGIGAAPVGIATTAFRISLLVPQGKLEDAVRACHARFVR